MDGMLPKIALSLTPVVPPPLAHQIRGIFNAPDAHEAQRLINTALKEWQVSPPQLAAWAEINLPVGFAVFGLPDAHH